MTDKKVAVITQVRMSSTRFPGKVMKSILGKPMLILFLERLKMMKTVDKIVVATTNEKDDKIIVETVEGYDKTMGIYRGSMHDVLDRYYKAAKESKVDIIVRITSDCPLIDPQISDKVVTTFQENKCDYCCNNLQRTYPHGLDTEVFSFEALEKAWKEAREEREREHVTPYIREHPDKFRIKGIKNEKNLSNLRWTVDYPEDFEFVKEIFERLYPKNKNFRMKDILDILEKEPELSKINERFAT